MLKPIENTAERPLIHHPSDALDPCVQYDASNAAWTRFDEQLSLQLREFEEQNRRFWTPQAVRRAIGR
jgi:hypothetical protein